MVVPSPKDFLKMMNDKKQQNIEKAEELVREKIRDMNFIFPSSKPKVIPCEIIGGKAIGLARLQELKEQIHDLNLLNYFIVPTGYFTLIRDQLNLIKTAKINYELSLNPDNLTQEQYDTLSITLTPKMETSIIDFISNKIYELATANFKGSHIIIRSSCSVEDNSSEPFAGVFESVPVKNINPREIAKAVKKVYQSVYTVKSMLYLNNYKKNLEDINMALVVQEMPETIYETGSIFINNGFVTNEIYNNNILELVATNHKNHPNVNNFPQNLIAQKIGEKINSKNFTVEYLKTDPSTYYIVQMRNIPTSNLSESKIWDIYQFDENHNMSTNYKNIATTQTNCLNLGTAEGIFVKLEEVDTHKEKDVIVITDYKTLFKELQYNYLSIKEKANIKGFIIECDEMFFHLSMIAKELINKPIVFYQKNSCFFKGRKNKDYLFDKEGSIYVGYHSSINLKK